MLSTLLSIIGVVILLWGHNLTQGVGDLITAIIGILFIIAGVVYSIRSHGGASIQGENEYHVKDPWLASFLFNDVRSASVWFAIRLYVGLAWLDAGWHKVTDPAWVGGGSALKAYWERAVAVPASGRPPIAEDYGWYREVLTFMLNNNWHEVMALVISYGEVLVGIGLILGVFTGIAAFFGTFMNMSFMLAGSASTNPVLFGAAVLLVLAWKVAGYWGVDRYLLPMLNTPWGRIHLPQRVPVG